MEIRFKKTMDFNSKHTKLSDRQVEFISKIFGQLIIEYHIDGTTKSYFPEYDNPNKFSVDEYRYFFAAKDFESVIITDDSFLKEDALVNKEEMTVINFADCTNCDGYYKGDCKTFWIYIDKHPILRFENLHLREYFTKIE